MDKRAEDGFLHAQDLEARAQAGDVDAMIEYGGLCARGIVPKAGYGRALFWYEKAASRGSADGMYQAGLLYDQGLGTPPSVETALGFLRRAASLGHAGACCELGRLLEQGRGSELQPGEAISAYFAASRLGHPRALVRVARFYLTGAPGLAPDAGIARSCLEQAARLGDAEAVALLQSLFAPKPMSVAVQVPSTPAGAPGDHASDAETLYKQGLALRDGREKDAAKAMETLRESARMGHSGAQVALAELCLEASDLRDEQEAFFWYGKAREQGVAEASLALGRMHAEGTGTAQDSAQALLLFLEAADRGLAEGLREAAGLVLGLPAPLALPDGRSFAAQDACWLLEQAAGRGDAQAMCDLGEIYREGKVCAKDEARAAALFAQAAERGLAEGQFCFACCLASGDGLPMDLEQAAQWCRKAAEQGHVAAQSMLGQFLIEGWGCQKDAAEAAKWLERAADAGSVSAMNRLAYLCERGLGLPADPERALQLRQHVAQQDYPGGALALARMRAEGAGAPSSIVAAFLWSRQELDREREQGKDGQATIDFIASLVAMLDEPDAVSMEDEAELERRAGQRSLWASYFLSRRLWIKPDDEAHKRAEQFLLTSAVNGLREAQEEAGRRCFAGDGLTQNDERAGHWLLRAQSATYSLTGELPEAELSLDGCLVGEGPTQGAGQHTAEDATGEVATDSVSGDAGGETSAGAETRSQTGADPASRTQGMGIPLSWKPLSKAASKGQPDAQYKLALRLLEGRGYEKDDAKASELFLKAALRGHVDAMFALGRLWAQGPDGIRDTGRAKIWLAKAASAGRPEAETLLAEILLKEAEAGDASARGSAREHLKHACQSGEPGALYAMSCLLLDDPDEGRLLLVGPDHASALAKAHACMAGAAARAHPEAALELAKMYLDGTGGPADAVLASAWLKEAQLLGAVKSDEPMFLDLRRRIESALPESERERRRDVIDIQSKASANDPGAIERLAFMTLEGDGVPQDFAEAQRLFAEAAKFGAENAEEILDKLKRSQSPHLQKRAEIDLRMAERGQGVAIENLALAYESGEGVPKNYREASRWMLRAARQGRATAQMRLGEYFEQGHGVPQDQTCAALWFAEAAKGGLRSGQFAYALRLLEGKGVPENPAEAFDWFQKAADQGSPYAADMLGHMLQEGRGVPADPERAFACFRKAADLGCDRSFFTLGQALETGTGTPKDPEGAVYCYRKACQAGVREACVNLACMLDDGRGVAGQSGEALRLLQSVADDTDCSPCVRGRALYRLGLLIRDGRGIASDPQRALDFLLEASELGNEEARNEAERMLVARGGPDAETGRRLLGEDPGEGALETGGIPALLAKAEAGDVDAQCQIGAKYYKGEGCERDYAKAAVWFEKAALQGDTIAQNNLGWLYQRGFGVAQDHEKAFEWYLKAAEAGLADAQNSVGWMMGEGLGCQKDEKAALVWLRKAAEGGSSIGQYNLGFSLVEGIGCEPDEKTAVQWFEKAASAGHARAQYMLALILKRPREVQPDPQRARELVMAAAEQGALPEAMSAVGDMYRFSDGAEMDLGKALDWYRKAAEKDDPNALFALAEMYVKGEGVEKDVDKALEYCSKAADLGNANAQFQLGHMLYAPPEGRQQDIEQARSWLRKAADQGHLVAQHVLSAIERTHGDSAEASRWLNAAAEGGLAAAQNELGWRLCGDGATESEYAQAAFWFEKAGDQGHAEALFNLGALYSRGDGVPEDHAKAAEYCLRAAELGYPAAQFVMGKFYAGGDGVQQNLDEAVRWLQLAVENGIEEAKQALVSVRSMQCDAVLAENDGVGSDGHDGNGGADGSAEGGGE